MATTAYTATSDNWLKVSDGLENVLISHKYVWPLQVHVGAADPAPDVAYHEISASDAFCMHGISGLNVYVRAGSPGGSIKLSVTAA
ncbi:hypothetical protein KL86PLE_110026 [uncultured Pleomorphomonas sp.]|uniref:Uncharacterized protein n=1 Tax=uncultured Pleomorphomonas sp. TaxID=442121 RepID=A0A212L6Y1_9HYPH|nr:hypothetical protein [uncultured Pleomorphomonas sp.]SCM73332.1 hypothetical protein KL86PLE_110026 [uncultured Pleomorphomonas sp.]